MNDEKYINFLKELASYIKPTNATVLSVLQAQGRYLAEDVIYYEQKNEARYAELDGYAVAWSVVASATPETSVILPIYNPNLPTTNQALFAYRIRKNECLPAHTDTVITPELLVNYNENDTYRESIEVAFKPSKKYVNTRTLNTDNRYLIHKSQKLTPEVVALLLAYGVKEVKVFERPVVGLIWGTSAEQINDDNKDETDNKDFSINYRYPVYWLNLLLQKNGVPVIDLGTINCHQDNINELIAKYSWQVDCLIWCGEKINDANISNRLISLKASDFSAYLGLNIYNYSSTLLFEIPQNIIFVNLFYNLVLNPVLRYMSGGALKVNYLEFAAPSYFNLPPNVVFCLLDKNYQPVVGQNDEFDILKPQNKSEYLFVVWERLKDLLNASLSTININNEYTSLSPINLSDTNAGIIIPIGNIKPKTKSFTILEALELQEETNNNLIYELISKKNEENTNTTSNNVETKSLPVEVTVEQTKISEETKPILKEPVTVPIPEQPINEINNKNQQIDIDNLLESQDNLIVNRPQETKSFKSKPKEDKHQHRSSFNKSLRFSGKRPSLSVGPTQPKSNQERSEKSKTATFSTTFIYGKPHKKRFIPHNKPDQPSIDSPDDE